MSATPPGWYDDGHGALRWWDGLQWTEHVHVPEQPQAAPVPEAPERAAPEVAPEPAPAIPALAQSTAT